MSRQIMYAVYRTKRKGNDNAPVAIFCNKTKAEDFMKRYEPTWCNVKWWIGRVWVEYQPASIRGVYTMSEHLG